MEHKRITKICQQCGNEFIPEHNNAKYCCEECRSVGIRAKQDAWRKEHVDKTRCYQRKYYRKKGMKKKTQELIRRYAPSKLDEIAVKYDTNYGAYQMEKTLAMIPKIDTDISRFKKKKEV